MPGNSQGYPRIYKDTRRTPEIHGIPKKLERNPKDYIIYLNFLRIPEIYRKQRHYKDTRIHKEFHEIYRDRIHKDARELQGYPIHPDIQDPSSRITARPGTRISPTRHPTRRIPWHARKTRKKSVGARKCWRFCWDEERKRKKERHGE